MSSLIVIHGPMFSRKTTTLLTHLTADDILIKPAMDRRYAENEVVSHDGMTRPALSIREWPSPATLEGKRLLIDEIQFFTSPYYEGDIVAQIDLHRQTGCDVVVAGLDRNWRGAPFPVTQALMQRADQLIPLFARCHVCDGGARYTWRRDGEGDLIALGNEDIYEARCRRHHPLAAEAVA